jgi:hypothetical protein
MSQNSRIKVSYFICLIIEGSGSGSRAGSGSLPLDKWIQIREVQKRVDPVNPDSDPEHCFRNLTVDFFVRRCCASALLSAMLG